MKGKELLSILLSIEDSSSVQYDKFCMGNISRTDYQRVQKVLINKQLNLINQFKKEVCEKQRYICQIEMDKDSVQDENNKWYVSCEDVLNAPEPE